MQHANISITGTLAARKTTRSCTALEILTTQFSPRATITPPQVKVNNAFVIDFQHCLLIEIAGSHFGNSRTTDPLSSSNNPTSTSGYGSTSGNDPLSTSTNPTSSTRYDNTTRNDPLSTSTNPISSTGYDNTTRNDPLSTSTNPTGTSQYDTGSTGRGVGGLNEPSASRTPGGFEDDAATTASISSGVPGQSQSHSGFTRSNNPDLGNTTGAGSSLTGNEYPDRSVGR